MIDKSLQLWGAHDETFQWIRPVYSCGGMKDRSQDQANGISSKMHMSDWSDTTLMVYPMLHTIHIK